LVDNKVFTDGFGTTVLRVLSTRHQLTHGYYTALQIVILLAPLWTNAFCYVCLGRMIHHFVPDQKLVGIRSSRFSLLWICLDFVYVLSYSDLNDELMCTDHTFIVLLCKHTILVALGQSY
jgi:hypothetical protein